MQCAVHVRPPHPFELALTPTSRLVAEPDICTTADWWRVHEGFTETQQNITKGV